MKTINGTQKLPPLIRASSHGHASMAQIHSPELHGCDEDGGEGRKEGRKEGEDIESEDSYPSFPPLSLSEATGGARACVSVWFGFGAERR